MSAWTHNKIFGISFHIVKTLQDCIHGLFVFYNNYCIRVHKNKNSDHSYRRSGFECAILLIANCEFLHKTQSKKSQKKEYAMNNVTRDHTPFAHVLACDPKQACVIDITRAWSTCMHARTAVNRREWVFFDSSSQPANTIANAKPSATVTQAVCYSINIPPHMQPHS